MDDLIAFLLARLDEDEQVARAAAELADAGTWAASPEGQVHDPSAPGRGWHYLAVGPDHRSLDDIGVHIARWDPARVLAEVEAKRRMIDERPTGAQFPDMEGGYESGWEDCFRYLALPYASHPDYREEWRP